MTPASSSQVRHREIVDVHVGRDDLHLISPWRPCIDCGGSSTTSTGGGGSGMLSLRVADETAVGQRVGEHLVHALHAAIITWSVLAPAGAEIVNDATSLPCRVRDSR